MTKISQSHPVHMNGKTVMKTVSGHTVWMISGQVSKTAYQDMAKDVKAKYDIELDP